MIKLFTVDHPITILFIILLSTGIFKCSIKDFLAKHIANHIPFNCEENERSKVHLIINIAFSLKKLIKSNFLRTFVY